MEKAFGVFNRLASTKDRICEFGDISIEASRSEKQRENNNKQTKTECLRSEEKVTKCAIHKMINSNAWSRE